MAVRPCLTELWREPTLEGFVAFCSRLRLDTGHWWRPEDWQLELLEPYYNGVMETGVTMPKGNGKSTLASGVLLHHLVSFPEPDAVIVAAAKDQAGKPFRSMANLMDRSVLPGEEYPWLEDYLKRAARTTYKLELLEGIGQVVCKPSEVRTVDGEGNTLALVEELSHHKTADLYGKLRDGLPKIQREWESYAGVTFKREYGQLISISTAGEEESPWGRMRKRALTAPNAKRSEPILGAQGCKVTASRDDDEGSFAYFEYSLADEDAERYEEFDLVKEANPLSSITPASLKRLYNQPSMEPWQWAKDRCGLVFGGENSAFDSIAWRRCGKGTGLERGEHCDVGIDLAHKFDWSFFVPLVYDDDEEAFIIGVPQGIPAPKDGKSIPYWKQLEAILIINTRNPIDRVVVDTNAGWVYLWEMALDRDRWPKHLQQQYPDVDLSGIEVIPHSQDPSPMSDASMGLGETIRAEKIIHPDHEELTAHIVAARARKTTGERWRIVKGAGGAHIDGAVALAIVLNEHRNPSQAKTQMVSAATYTGWRI